VSEPSDVAEIFMRIRAGIVTEMFPNCQFFTITTSARPHEVNETSVNTGPQAGSRGPFRKLFVRTVMWTVETGVRTASRVAALVEQGGEVGGRDSAAKFVSHDVPKVRRVSRVSSRIFSRKAYSE
jgi:hypothetical protein